MWRKFLSGREIRILRLKSYVNVRYLEFPVRDTREISNGGNKIVSATIYYSLDPV